MFFFRTSRSIIHILPSGTSGAVLAHHTYLSVFTCFQLARHLCSVHSPGRIPTTYDLRLSICMQASALLSHKSWSWQENVLLSIISVAERSMVAFDAMTGLITKSHTSHELIHASFPLCSVTGWPYDNLLETTAIQLLRCSVQQKSFLCREVSEKWTGDDLSCLLSRVVQQKYYLSACFDSCMQLGYRNHRLTSLLPGSLSCL
ncbi:hypothetical protein F4604DRAFT_149491 [Suillus subluteus]|nr:hypothetical protein F4604DRAFT_149491 [Suillus subluteus]